MFHTTIPVSVVIHFWLIWDDPIKRFLLWIQYILYLQRWNKTHFRNNYALFSFQLCYATLLRNNYAIFSFQLCYATLLRNNYAIFSYQLCYATLLRNNYAIPSFQTIFLLSPLEQLCYATLLKNNYTILLSLDTMMPYSL